MGDLRRFDSLEELQDEVRKYPYQGSRTAQQLWILRNLESGDEVIANKGIDVIVGVGKVTGPYRWNANHQPSHSVFPHIVPVDWDTSREEQAITPQESWRNITLAYIDSPKLFRSITGRRLPKDANKRHQSVVARKELDILGQLDKKHQGLVRAEQTLLRKRLLGGRDHGRCVICGAELPVELLVAAHIKPRAKCSNRERRDWANIVPMCLLGCDALFERGRVAVVKGRLDIRFNHSISDSRLKAILKSLRRREIAVEPDQKKYFAAHASLPR